MIQTINIPLDSLPEAFAELNYTYLTYDFGDQYLKPNGMILYPDGTILRYSEKEVQQIDDEIKVADGNLKWRIETRIKKEGVQKIKALLDSFTPDTLKEIPSEALLLEYRQNGQLLQTYTEGNFSTPKSYKLFTTINDLISKYTIGK